MHTLATRHRLAKFHFESSRLETARQQFEDVLREKTEVLGGQHHATLITREHLALTLAALGHRQTAAEDLEALLAIRLRTAGEHHPLTSLTLANLESVRESMQNKTGKIPSAIEDGSPEPNGPQFSPRSQDHRQDRTY
ncbi:tetratricopeptide repeat protein [Saccharothrix sp. NRRL B-16348]|uniref:tetratricopeptide repeat protein n=1 Tax=Saccharothrix sp. NRRL B-16348 TaxID=1415542 RepID=UPI003FA6FCEC